MSWERGADLFLAGSGIVFTLAFALPLLFAPLRWAAALGWTLPERTDLAVYLGRCLGAAGLGLVSVMARAIGAPREHLDVFELVAGLGALLAAIHVVGWLRREQPWTETAEIALWAATAAAGLVLRLGLD
jgi:hypothetical protein